MTVTARCRGRSIGTRLLAVLRFSSFTWHREICRTSPSGCSLPAAPPMNPSPSLGRRRPLPSRYWSRLSARSLKRLPLFRPPPSLSSAKSFGCAPLSTGSARAMGNTASRHDRARFDPCRTRLRQRQDLGYRRVGAPFAPVRFSCCRGESRARFHRREFSRCCDRKAVHKPRRLGDRPETLASLVTELEATTEIVLCEGVMGLFDGTGPDGETGSTAELARLTGWPVVLIIDARGQGASVAATLRGFLSHQPSLSLAGVIFNRVSGE